MAKKRNTLPSRSTLQKYVKESLQGCRRRPSDNSEIDSLDAQIREREDEMSQDKILKSLTFKRDRLWKKLCAEADERIAALRQLKKDVDLGMEVTPQLVERVRLLCS